MNDHIPLIPSRITDDEVARLPVHAGRADLLEDLMATPVVDRVDHRPTRPRRPRRPVSAWLAVPAAAAAITAIALVPALRNTLDGPGPGAGVGTQVAGGASASPNRPVSTSTVRSVPGGRYVALDAPGWTVSSVYEESGFVEINYEKADGLQVGLVQYAADQYDSYYRDREGVSDPAPARLIGRASATFTYSANDHATIRPAEAGQFLEVRASGMDLAAYDSLLDRIVQTDAPGFAAALPDDIVTPFNRDEAVNRLLGEASVPDGFAADEVDLKGFNDAYQSAVRVAGAVGCAWLDVYAQGGSAARQQAQAALDGSRDWPLLKGTVAEGDYASEFWGVADDLRAGRPLAELRWICP